MVDLKSCLVSSFVMAMVGAACVSEPLSRPGPDDVAEVSQEVNQVRIFNGYPVSGLSGALGSTSDTYLYSIEMAPHQPGEQLTIALRGANGDADLYVRKESVPTTDAFDCAPLNDGSSNEACAFPEDIDSINYFTNIDAFAAYSNAILHVYYEKVMTLGTANSFIWGGSQTSRSVFRLDVPSGKGQLRIKTTPVGSGGSVALYARFGDVPLIAHGLSGGSFTSIFNCSSTVPGGSNLCVVSNPAGGSWYVLVEGRSTYNVTLEATTVR